MLNHYKYYLFSALFLLTFFVWHFPPNAAYAQSCQGTSNSNCPGHTYYNCIPANPSLGLGAACQPLNYSGAGYACGAYGGTGTCDSCVPNNQTCYVFRSADGSTCVNFQGDITCDSCMIAYDTSTAYAGCGGVFAQLCSGANTGCVNYCTSGTTSCGTCTGGGLPANECGDTTSGTSRVCQHNAPQTCTNQSFTQTGCTNFIYNCSSNYTCPIGSGGPVNCQTTVNVHAFRDENHDGNQDPGEVNLGGVTTDYAGNLNTTNSSGNTSYGGFTSGTTVSINASISTPFNGTTYTNPSITHSITLSNSNGGYTLNYAFIPTYTVSGHVFVDYNHNGTENAEDVHYSGAGITISLTGHGSTTTNGSGNFSFTGVITGNYTLSISGVPSAYATTTPTSVGITVSGNTTNNTFGVTPLYNIAGIVYNDFDAGDCYNPTTHGCTDNTTNPATVHGAGIDTPYSAGSSTVTVVGTGVNQTLTQSDGTYDTGQVLKSGTYTVTFTTLPTNYHMTYPVGSIPPTFTVTVGTPSKSIACSVGTYNDATCDSWGSIANLNFGMNDEISHVRFPCTDVRDETTTQDFIPNNATCGILSGNYAIVDYNSYCSTGAGIYSSGNVTPDFGFGQASPNNWLVGGATSENFSPVNPGVIRTSVSYLQTTITNNGTSTTNLSDVCTTTSCYLPDNLPSGVYVWPYDTTFMGTHNSSTGVDTPGTYTFPVDKNYVFIIGDGTNKSDITFKTKILVPIGSTAIFTSAKDILVDPSVGESDITSTAGDLEGFYSADESFIIESAYVNSNRCTDSGGTKDLRFNLIGSVVVNAAGNGGAVTNQRDLCFGDLTCPTYTIGNTDGGSGGSGGSGGGGSGIGGLGYTYILNAPQVIKHKNTFWQELAP